VRLAPAVPIAGRDLGGIASLTFRNPRETILIGEWWYVDTVESPSSGQSFGLAFQVQDGANRLTTAALTSPRAEPPPLAP